MGGMRGRRMAVGTPGSEQVQRAHSAVDELHEGRVIDLLDLVARQALVRLRLDGRREAPGLQGGGTRPRAGRLRRGARAHSTAQRAQERPRGSRHGERASEVGSKRACAGREGDATSQPRARLGRLPTSETDSRDNWRRKSYTT